MTMVIASRFTTMLNADVFCLRDESVVILSPCVCWNALTVIMLCISTFQFQVFILRSSMQHDVICRRDLSYTATALPRYARCRSLIDHSCSSLTTSYIIFKVHTLSFYKLKSSVGILQTAISMCHNGLDHRVGFSPTVDSPLYHRTETLEHG